jgi:hypothetical protein
MIEITVCNQGTENKAGEDIREQEPTSFTQCDTEHRKKDRSCGVQRQRIKKDSGSPLSRSLFITGF